MCKISDNSCIDVAVVGSMNVVDDGDEDDVTLAVVAAAAAAVVVILPHLGNNCDPMDGCSLVVLLCHHEDQEPLYNNGSRLCIDDDVDDAPSLVAIDVDTPSCLVSALIVVVPNNATIKRR